MTIYNGLFARLAPKASLRAGVGRHDLTPQNSKLFLRIKPAPALNSHKNPHFYMVIK